MRAASFFGDYTNLQLQECSFSIRNSHQRELEFLDEYNMRKINLTPS